MKNQLLFFVFVFVVQEISDARIVLHCGQMADMKKEVVLEKISIVVEGEQIKSIEKGFLKDPHAIDLSGKTCLPGLIDLHVHFEQDFPEIIGFYHPDESRAIIDSLDFPRKNLMAGFTTVRDLASIRNVTEQLKYAIKSKKIVGPRILNARHPVSAPGGHGDFLSKLSEDGRPRAKDIYKSFYDYHFVQNTEDVSKWFKYQFVERPLWYKSFKSVSSKDDLTPDAIKIMATGGVVSDNKDSHGPQLSFEIISEVVKNARQKSKELDKDISVTAHAHGLVGIAHTVMAGANSVEHATELFVDIDESDTKINKEERQKLRTKVHELMKKNRIFMIPTLIAIERVGSLAREGKLPDHIAKKSIAVGKKAYENFRLAVENNIPIAFGSDTGISKHGDNWKELLLMVEHGKMSPMMAIKSATISASAALMLDSRIGSLEAGKLADIIATDGNPTQKIEDIKNVRFVMKGGEVFKNLQ